MDLEQGAQEGIAGKQEGETAHVDAKESVEAPVKSDASTANGKRAKLSISKYGYAAIALFIIVIILDIYLRTGMLKYSGFFEPDGFYHFSVIRAAVTHDFAIPRTLVLSGFPTHFEITEPLGLYFVTLFPYAILRYFGASYYTVMRLVPILFGVLDAIGAFYIVRYFAKSRVLAFLAMFFLAISSGDIARTAALVYRGDGFITSFMILSPYLKKEYSPSSSLINKINSTMALYKKQANPPLADCLIETGVGRLNLLL